MGHVVQPLAAQCTHINILDGKWLNQDRSCSHDPGYVLTANDGLSSASDLIGFTDVRSLWQCFPDPGLYSFTREPGTAVSNPFCWHRRRWRNIPYLLWWIMTERDEDLITSGFSALSLAVTVFDQKLLKCRGDIRGPNRPLMSLQRVLVSIQSYHKGSCSVGRHFTGVHNFKSWRVWYLFTHHNIILFFAEYMHLINGCANNLWPKKIQFFMSFCFQKII